MLHSLALANLSHEIHESMASNYSQSNNSEASNLSLSQSYADSYPSLSQICNEIDQNIEAGLLAQAEAIENELSIPIAINIRRKMFGLLTSSVEFDIHKM